MKNNNVAYQLCRIDDGRQFVFNTTAGMFISSGGSLFTSYDEAKSARREHGGFVKRVELGDEETPSAAFAIAFAKVGVVGEGERVARWPRPLHRTVGRRMVVGTREVVCQVRA